MRTESQNKIFFERANIVVTDTRFDTGSESYPIRKISGVTIESAPRRTRMGIVLVVVGVAALLGGMVGNLAILIVSGAAFTVGGAMIFFAKVTHTVVLTTRGRDVRAMTSKDAALISAIATALKAAMATRGE
jgi:membrane associated rhomboid family serine protease